MRLEPNCFPPSFLPPNQQEAFCCHQRIPPPSCQNAAPRPSRAAPPVPGDRAGTFVPILQQHCSAGPGPWGEQCPRSPSPHPSPPPDPGADPGAGQLGRGAPPRVLPPCLREPGAGHPLPPRAPHAATQVSSSPSLRHGAMPGGAAGHEPPVWEGSGISLLGLGEPKPRGMNEAHSWLNNIREAPRREQLRGPESRSWSEWNGKNQLLGAGSA